MKRVPQSVCGAENLHSKKGGGISIYRFQMECHPGALASGRCIRGPPGSRGGPGGGAAGEAGRGGDCCCSHRHAR